MPDWTTKGKPDRLPCPVCDEHCLDGNAASLVPHGGDHVAAFCLECSAPLDVERLDDGYVSATYEATPREDDLRKEVDRLRLDRDAQHTLAEKRKFDRDRLEAWHDAAKKALDDAAVPHELTGPDARPATVAERIEILMKDRDRWADTVAFGAGECLVAIPEPGSDMAAVCAANGVLRRERQDVIAVLSDAGVPLRLAQLADARSLTLAERVEWLAAQLADVKRQTAEARALRGKIEDWLAEHDTRSTVAADPQPSPPLNPGITGTVLALQAAGFETTDSGDGKTHDFGCDRPNPYVVIRTLPHRLIRDLDWLVVWLGNRGVSLVPIGHDGPWCQASIDPANWTAFIDLNNVDDDRLGLDRDPRDDDRLWFAAGKASESSHTGRKDRQGPAVGVDTSRSTQDESDPLSTDFDVLVELRFFQCPDDQRLFARVGTKTRDVENYIREPDACPCGHALDHAGHCDDFKVSARLLVEWGSGMIAAKQSLAVYPVIDRLEDAELLSREPAPPGSARLAGVIGAIGQALEAARREVLCPSADANDCPFSPWRLRRLRRREDRRPEPTRCVACDDPIGEPADGAAADEDPHPDIPF